MKPKNFPARKLIRRIEAIQRQEGRGHELFTEAEYVAINTALMVRTKKRRS